jgi:hypothetical protein
VAATGVPGLWLDCFEEQIIHSLWLTLGEKKWISEDVREQGG